MKKTLLISVFACLFFHFTSTAQIAKASVIPDSSNAKKQWDKHPTLDIYGAIPFKHSGGGAGMGIFGPAYKLGYFNPVYLRIGGEFYITELSHRTLRNVPLSSPQTGDAKIRLSQNTLGFNLVARFSTPYAERITPYGDLFIGTNNFWTGMKITPNQYQEGYDESNSESIANSWQFSYGASAGVLWGLGKHVKLNTGIMYLNYFKNGNVLDISKATISEGSIVTENATTPMNLWILKVGFTFIISNDPNKKRKCHCDCEREKRIAWHNELPTEPTPNTREESKWNNTTSTNSSRGGRSNSVNVSVRSSK